MPLVVLAAVLSLVIAAAARAAADVDELLARKFSPILMLRAQENPPCDSKDEQYHPTLVDVVFERSHAHH